MAVAGLLNHFYVVGFNVWFRVPGSCPFQTLRERERAAKGSLQHVHIWHGKCCGLPLDLERGSYLYHVPGIVFMLCYTVMCYTLLYMWLGMCSRGVNAV